MNLPWPHRFFLAIIVFISPLDGVRAGPIEATFEKADVRIPDNVVEKYGLDFRPAYDRLEAEAKNGERPNYAKARLGELAKRIPPGVKLPLIVYFHGCAGIRQASMGHLNWLAKLDDFVVMAPDSFARPRPQYCFSDHTVDVSIFRPVTLMRRAEIDYALGRVVKIPWVDIRNIFLIGHSQGGGTVAGYRGMVKIRGRIILNGSCNPALGGDGMKDDEALLTFDTGRDPWFLNYPNTKCREYVSRHPNGKSVYQADSATHDLVREYWPVVKAFLTENRR